jgi:hypothetical protein
MDVEYSYSVTTAPEWQMKQTLTDLSGSIGEVNE